MYRVLRVVNVYRTLRVVNPRQSRLEFDHNPQSGRAVYLCDAASLICLFYFHYAIINLLLLLYTNDLGPTSLLSVIQLYSAQPVCVFLICCTAGILAFIHSRVEQQLSIEQHLTAVTPLALPSADLQLQSIQCSIGWRPHSEPRMRSWRMRSG